MTTALHQVGCNLSSIEVATLGWVCGRPFCFTRFHQGRSPEVLVRVAFFLTKGGLPKVCESKRMVHQHLSDRVLLITHLLQMLLEALLCGRCGVGSQQRGRLPLGCPASAGGLKKHSARPSDRRGCRQAAACFPWHRRLIVVSLDAGPTRARPSTRPSLANGSSLPNEG